MTNNKKIQKLENISRSTELLYRRTAMLNLYLCRIRNAGAEKARLEQEVKIIQNLIEEIELEIEAG